MLAILPPTADRDARLLVAARSLRSFGDGLTSVLLPGWMLALGHSALEIGALSTAALAGSALLTLGVGLIAHRVAPRALLLAACALMLATGLGFSLATAFGVLLVLGFVGTLNPSAGDVSLFVPIEQALLTESVAAGDRTALFARYNVCAALSVAAGSLAAGVPARLASGSGLGLAFTARFAFAGYGMLGIAAALLYARLASAKRAQRAEGERRPLPSEASAAEESAKRAQRAEGERRPLPSEASAAEESAKRAQRAEGERRPLPSEASAAEGIAPQSATRPRSALTHSRGIVLRLTALFSLDSFGGGFVVNSILVLWLLERHALSLETAGAVMAAAALLSGLSQLASAPLARRIGLIRTMVFTHLPANISLVLAALVPDASAAIAFLLLRAALSQMDVPARQAYVMSVVRPEERAAAASFTNVPRSLASAASPSLAGALLSASSFGWPLVAGGVLKMIYDLLLLVGFRHRPAPGESSRRSD